MTALPPKLRSPHATVRMGGRYIAVDPLDGVGRPIEEVDASILSCCRTYRSVDEHVLNAAAALWRKAGIAVDISEIRGRVEKLAAEGLLVSAGDVIGRPAARSVSPIQQVNALTCGRPQALKRWLRSFSSNLDTYDRETPIVVVEDSPATADQTRTQAIVERYQKDTRRKIRMISRSERRSWAYRLARSSGTDLEVVEFGLLGVKGIANSEGSARNSQLTLQAGVSFVSFDDDMVCDICRLPESEPGLQLTSQSDPSEFWFPMEFGGAASESVDLLGRYEELLGRPVCDVATEAASSESLDIRRLSGKLELSLRKRCATVAVATCGFFGDSGSGANGYFGLDSRSANRLLESEQRYLSAVRSRRVLRGASRPVVCTGGGLMAASLGFSQSGLAPPFFPALRGSDAVFSQVLETSCPSAFAAYLPLALRHSPVTFRRSDMDEVWLALGGVRCTEIVQVAVRAASAEKSPSIASLGVFLENLATMSVSSFQDFIRARCLEAGSWQVERLQERLGSARLTPPWFRPYIERYIDIVSLSQRRPDYVSPTDLADLVGRDNALPEAQRLLALYGRLLQAWPELMNAARRLCSGGEPVA